jgi:hypothetical protein
MKQRKAEPDGWTFQDIPHCKQSQTTVALLFTPLFNCIVGVKLFGGKQGNSVPQPAPPMTMKTPGVGTLPRIVELR